MTQSEAIIRIFNDSDRLLFTTDTKEYIAFSIRMYKTLPFVEIIFIQQTTHSKERGMSLDMLVDHMKKEISSGHLKKESTEDFIGDLSIDYMNITSFPLVFCGTRGREKDFEEACESVIMKGTDEYNLIIDILNMRDL